MQELDFTLDGVPASSVGIELCKPIVFSAAVPKVTAIEIPGRNGDLHIDDGAFENRTGTAECSVTDILRGSSERMADISAFLFASGGYRKLTVSDDTEHYWYARVSNGAAIASRLGKLNVFGIEFDCKPYRTVNGAEKTIEFPDSSFHIANPTGFRAYPLLYVSASAAGTISNPYGSIKILGATDGEMIIDCEDKRAYYSYGRSADHLIKASSFPYFPPIGNNGLVFDSGIISLRVAPRWRTL